MDRFTKKVVDVVVYTGPGVQYPDTGDTPAEMRPQEIRTALARLAEYEDIGLTPEEVKNILDAYTRTFGKGVSFNRIQVLIKADREHRLRIVPRCGDELYEADPAHGVVKHTVTEIHWVANTVALDDSAQTWADYFTDEDIHTAYPTREATEAALANLEGWA